MQDAVRRVRPTSVSIPRAAVSVVPPRDVRLVRAALVPLSGGGIGLAPAPGGGGVELAPVVVPVVCHWFGRGRVAIGHGRGVAVILGGEPLLGTVAVVACAVPQGLLGRSDLPCLYAVGVEAALALDRGDGVTPAAGGRECLRSPTSRAVVGLHLLPVRGVVWRSLRAVIPPE